jgi:hypothetical protein
MFMTMMGWFLRCRMGITKDIAEMDEVCQRMQRLLVRSNSEAYYINDDGAIIRRAPDGAETVAVARATPFNVSTNGRSS